MRSRKQTTWSVAALGRAERFSQAERILDNSNPEAWRHGESLRSGDLKTGSSTASRDRSGNRVIRTHTAELTILKRFVSGHDFSRAEKIRENWALAPAAVLVNKMEECTNCLGRSNTRFATTLCCLLAVFLASIPIHAQTATVTGSVEVTADRNHSRHKTSNSGVVVWLTPVGQADAARSTPASFAKERFTLQQKNKTFVPHVLVVPVGAEVGFPNKDPFFHNVFSLFEGKRFDLGLYESGTTRSLRFDRPGISYLFCNIHPEMSAVIIALDTPYYASSNAGGQIAIPNVPVGQYVLHVWREGSSMETLKNLSKPVFVSANLSSFERLVVPDNASFPLTHKNKYGRDYEDPTPPGRIYIQP